MPSTYRQLDLDLDFVANPVSGDAPKKTNNAALKRAIKNIILTKNFERGFSPRFGTDLDSLLFEKQSGLIAGMIGDVIHNAIIQNERRIATAHISVVPRPGPSSSGYDVTIRFRPRGQEQSDSFQTSIG